MEQGRARSRASSSGRVAERMEITLHPGPFPSHRVQATSVAPTLPAAQLPSLAVRYISLSACSLTVLKRDHRYLFENPTLSTQVPIAHANLYTSCSATTASGGVRYERRSCLPNYVCRFDYAHSILPQILSIPYPTSLSFRPNIHILSYCFNFRAALTNPSISSSKNQLLSSDI